MKPALATRAENKPTAIGIEDEDCGAAPIGKANDTF
jgi:hypothetical protein